MSHPAARASGFLNCQYEWDPVSGEWYRPINCEPPGQCPPPPTIEHVSALPITITFPELGPVAIELCPMGRVVIKAGAYVLAQLFQRQPLAEQSQTASNQLVNAVELQCTHLS
jgi:hypothetical protein